MEKLCIVTQLPFNCKLAAALMETYHNSFERFAGLNRRESRSFIRCKQANDGRWSFNSASCRWGKNNGWFQSGLHHSHGFPLRGWQSQLQIKIAPGMLADRNISLSAGCSRAFWSGLLLEVEVQLSWPACLRLSKWTLSKAKSPRHCVWIRGRRWCRSHGRGCFLRVVHLNWTRCMPH